MQLEMVTPPVTFGTDLHPLLPGRDELLQVEPVRLLPRDRGEVLQQQDVVVPVVRLLTSDLRRPLAVAAVEVPRAPADAVRLAAGLLARRVVLVDPAVELLDPFRVVLVVRAEAQRVLPGNGEQSAVGGRSGAGDQGGEGGDAGQVS